MRYIVTVHNGFLERYNDFNRCTTPTNWLAVVRQNGDLEIYKLSDVELQLSFQTSALHLGHRLLVNMYQKGATLSSTNYPCDIIEIGIFPLGHLQRRPILVTRTADFNILIYEAVACVSTDAVQDRLHIRFRKLDHNLLLQQKKT